MTALYHVCLSCHGVECECPCVHTLGCVLVCVLSSTDISSNVVDISRGFEDLIPSVFEELCAALLKTQGNTAADPAECPAFRALLYTIWISLFSLTRSVIRRRPALYNACLLEMTGSLLGLLLSLAVFP